MKEAREISISKLWLDNDNPRHEHIDNDEEILATLVKEERVINLLKDMSERGPSPIDIIGVIPHPKIKDEYLVVEGNRRLCAAKLLHDYNKISDSKLRRKVEAIAKKAKYKPRKLTCVEFDSREEANKWIELRHSGEQEGVGVKNWNAVQKARFSSEIGKPNYNVLATEIVDYAFNNEIIDKETKDNVAISTLSRYLGNPVFRSTIGLVDKTSLKVEIPEDQFKNAISKFINDAISGIAHSRSNAEERKKYANTFVKEKVILPGTRLDSPISLDIKGKKKSINKTKTTRNPDKRHCLVPASYAAKIKNKKILRIFHELKTIHVEDYSNAAAFLLRMFVEGIIKEYLKKNEISYDNNKDRLHVLIKKVANDLKKDGVSEREFKPLNVAASNPDSLLSPETLGNYVHGQYHPTKTDLIRTWDSFEPAIDAILRKI